MCVILLIFSQFIFLSAVYQFPVHNFTSWLIMITFHKETEASKVLHFHSFHKNLQLGVLKGTKWTSPLLVCSMISKLQYRHSSHLCCLSALPTNQYMYCLSACCLLFRWQWEDIRRNLDFCKMNQRTCWLKKK